MNLNLEESQTSGLLDKTGAIVSWLCAVHCLILPFAIAFLPFLGLSFLLDESVEWLIIGVSVVIAFLSLLPAYFHRHRKLSVLIFFGAGISAIVASHLFFEGSFALKTPFILAGAIFVSVAHLINYRACRKCPHCREISALKETK